MARDSVQGTVVVVTLTEPGSVVVCRIVGCEYVSPPMPERYSEDAVLVHMWEAHGVNS